MNDDTPRLTQTQTAIAQSAYDRLLSHRAAIIATPTGSGKTYIACDIIQRMKNDLASHALCAIVAAPAHLRDMWLRAVSAFQLNIRFVSYHMLSLDKIAVHSTRPILWIFDEAHALKNPSTKRFHVVQKYTSIHYICLMTATPVTMSWKDLYALVQLCGYPSAQKYFDKYMIQRFARAICIDPQIPDLIAPERIFRHSYDAPVMANSQSLDDIVDNLLSIRIYLHDGDEIIRESPILSLVLMHRLLSHPTSCILTLERILCYYKNARIHGNRVLSKREFFSLMGSSGKQLFLPFEDMIFGRKLDDASQDSIDQTLQRMKRALALLRQIDAGDDIVLQNIQKIIETIPRGVPIVLFSQYADTARYYADNLKTGRPLALLTAHSARYGKTPCKRELIEPVFDASCNIPNFYENARIPPPEILICSDAFSSGHNLQRAAHLIHLDLPWNPATQIQREGRLLRIGQTASSIHFYTPAYPQNVPAFSTYARHVEQRLKSRKRLLLTWNAQTLAPTFDSAIRLDVEQFPRFWARYADQWIPIAPDNGPIGYRIKSTQMTTFGRVRLMSISAVQKKLKCVWRALKRDYSHDQTTTSLLFDFINRAALFPRLTHAIGTSEATQALDIAVKMPVINAVFQLPPPSTPCQLFTCYPQDAEFLPTNPPK